MKLHGLSSLIGAAVLCVFVSGASAATVQVNALAMSFDPAEITIDVGDTVHWVNLQSLAHTVTEVAEADYDSNTNNPLSGGFSSGSPAAVDEFMFTFDTPGEYFYICTTHIASGMKGKITVSEPIPSMTTWGLILFATLILAAGTWFVIKRKPSMA